MKLFIGLLIFISYSQVFASGVCENLDDIPVQHGGRVKTFFVLATETINSIAIKESGRSPLKVFCKASLSGSEDKLKLKINHTDIKNLLGDDEFLLKDVLGKKDLIRSEIIKNKQQDPYKKSLTRLYNKIEIYEGMINGESWTFFENNEWAPIKDIRDLKENIVKTRIEASKYDYDVTDKSYLLENKLKKYKLFSISLLFAILAILISVLVKRQLYAGIFIGLSILIEFYAIYLRILISGRAPITNMYETVMFSGIGALLISIWVYLKKKDRAILIAGLSCNVMCLFMLKFSKNMLDESISPLVPVLRDNFWLSTHVTTIMLSYAAFALSWVLANIVLIKNKWFNLEQNEHEYYKNLIYTCIKIGVILLSTGIILGGIWADYSWGRFWGWDPKETWSLIVFLFYMALLHGKSTNWINTNRFIVLSAIGFMVVMMAWFGVNYILAAGLHSYGFSEGGAIFLGSFFGIQILVLILTIRKK